MYLQDTTVPTTCTYNDFKILIKSNYIPTRLGGDHHHHQGRSNYTNQNTSSVYRLSYHAHTVKSTTLSALRTGRLYLPGYIPRINFR